MFVADVVAVSVDENYLDEKGKLRLDKSNLLVFSHGEYFNLGKKLGPIGLSVANKKKGKGARVKKSQK